MLLTGPTICLRTQDSFFFCFSNFASGNTSVVVGSIETALDEVMMMPAAIPFPVGPLLLGLSCANL